MSAQYCGCDPEFVSSDGQKGWVCEQHQQRNLERFVSEMERLAPPGGTGDPRFHALLKQLGDLHDQKQRDYGTAHDPFANVRASAEWGIAPWVGALARLNDKVKRLQKFAREGNLANESAEDSMLDIAVYSLIALILFKEQR